VSSDPALFEEGEQPNSEIVLMPSGPISGVQRRVTANAAEDTHPAWSPDASRIAFQSNRDGNWEIYVIEAEGSGEAIRVTAHPAADQRAAWSPDGTTIAFASDRSGAGEIYLVQTSGGEPARLTKLGRNATDPDWSPDSRRIVFSSRDATGFVQVYAIDADGTDLTRLTEAGIPSRQPVWSPDGTQIAFTRERAIWTMNADGTDQARIASDPERALDDPEWHPDGGELWFDTTDPEGRRSLGYKIFATGAFIVTETNGHQLAWIRAP
jgi:Tol biopolymer transport system component